MASIDFTTAFGRLLADGRLRDALNADGPALLARLDVLPTDSDRLLELPAAELEFQARVLLRKRFEQVCAWLPETCRQLGARAWPLFTEYGRVVPPTNRLADVIGFVDSLPESCSVSEANRIQFVTGQSLFHFDFVRKMFVRGRSRRALQILWRTRTGWREFALSFGL